MKNDLRVGMYVRTKDGKIFKTDRDKLYLSNDKKNLYKLLTRVPHDTINYKVSRASDKLTDLAEYMDLLVIENKVKDINNNEVYFFNPVRCDGFTEFEKNQHCIVINMDYIVPVENIKIYQILTHEQFDQMSYKVEC